MELTNGEAYTVNGALRTMVGVRLPISRSVKVAELAIKIGDRLKVIEEVKRGLVETYSIESKKGTGGEVISSKDGDGALQEFVDKFNELMSGTWELEFEERISINLGNLDEGTQLEPTILLALGKLIEVI